MGGAASSAASRVLRVQLVPALQKHPWRRGGSPEAALEEACTSKQSTGANVSAPAAVPSPQPAVA
ncbi:hypothetical protein ABBQ38_011080 [Trebouxia sp. C0009 RCD-2024]